MSTRTIYTASVSVPVYASWKCEKCGHINFSVGTIVCRRQDSTSSSDQFHNDEAKEYAAYLAHNEWLENAYNIIVNMRNNAESMRDSFFLQESRCKECGLKPKWYKKRNFFLVLSRIILIIAAFFGMVAFSFKTNVAAWIFLVAILALASLAYLPYGKNIDIIRKLPKEYTPIIGSLNEELIEYAAHRDVVIPNQFEVIEIAAGLKTFDDINTQRLQSILERSPKPSVPIKSYCPKCGAQLQDGLKVCHICGPKV